MASSKPRICQILDGRPVDEAQRLGVHLTQRLGNDFDFVFVFLGDAGAFAERLGGRGIKTFTLLRRPGLDWRCSQRLASLLRRERINLVHGHQLSTFLQILVSRLLYRDSPILLTEHGRRTPPTTKSRPSSARGVILEARDRVVAVSHYARLSLLRYEGMKSGQVDVIYNDVLPLTPPEPDHKASARRDLGIEPDAFLILHSAPFEPSQDHLLAVRALQQVVRRLPHARLVLVGEGPEQDMVRAFVRRSGLEAHVLFLGACATEAPLLEAADVVLCTSQAEWVPSVLIRALAASRPVVATRTGGAAEIVEDRVCGLLACAGDYAALADHLCRLATEPELGRQLGRQARARAETMYVHEETSRRYGDLYRTMLGSSS